MWCEIFRKISVLLLVAAVFSPSALYAACSSPAGVAGEMGYNLTGSGEMEYCNDTSWVVMDGGVSGATLIGHWTLDETSGSSIADSSANSNAGTWTDGGDNDVSGETIAAKVGTGLDYDGVATSVSLGSPAALDNIFNGGGTIAMWFRADGPGEAGYGRLFEKAAGTGAADGYSFTLMSGSTLQLWREFSDGDATWGSISITFGEWYHVAVVYDDSSASNDPQIYLNGALVATSDNNSTGTADDDSASDLIIGNSTAGDRTFDGVIDDVRVYDAALSAQEVQDLYLSSALVGHWKLDETSGTVAADSSGNGYNGTMSGFDGASGTVDGKVGTALTFVDGSTDRIFMGDNLDLIGMPFTISAWIKPNSISNDDSIVDKLASGGNYRFKLDNNGVLAFGIRDASNVYQGFGTASNAVETGKWTHVAVSYDNATTGTIYVNGVQSAQKTDFSITRGDVSTQLAFGYSNNNSAWFNGAIDDVRIYSVDLSPAQITDIYYCSRPGLSYYDSTDHVSKWCGNGAVYKSGVAGSGGGGCAAGGALAAGAEGAMQYDTGTNKMVFCDGANWVNIPN